jgi:hypothetical protein
MTDSTNGDATFDPPGGHDREALEDAAKKMHSDEGPEESIPDPPGGHDPAALKDAAEKFGTEV